MTFSTVIGRFQPLCVNHLSLFEQALEYGRYLVVAVGQPNYERAKEVFSERDYSLYLHKYVLPFERVKEQINSVVDCDIFPLKDILDRERYADYVFEEFAKRDYDLSEGILFGENKKTYDCFEGLTRIEVAKDNTNVHATDVRRELHLTGRSNLVLASLTAEEIFALGKAQYEIDRLLK